MRQACLSLMSEDNTLKHLFLNLLVLAAFAPSAFAANTLHDKTEKTSPATSDETYIWDVSDSTLKKTAVGNLPVSTAQQTAIDAKSDKTAVIRYWSDWPDASPGNTMAVGTIVAYEGELYKATQEFVKTAGATPAGFTTYFTKITSVGGATVLDDLTDVDTTGKSEGKLLKFDASGNLVVGTDDTGSGSVPDGSTDGQILIWATDQWIASNIPTLNQDTTGNAATADKLSTARTIGGISFDGSANIDLPGVNTAGNQSTTGTAAGLASQYIDWSASSGGSSIANKPTIPTVSDTAYDATSWNDNTDAPSKNAVRDEFEGKANVSCFADETSFNACFALEWPTGSQAWPSAAGIMVYGGSSAYGNSLTLDTDLSSVSASDDSVPSAKATKTALDLKVDSSFLGTAAGLNVGTSPGNVVQLGGACTVGDGAYTDQTTCEANSGEWVGVLSIICDPDTEDCNTKLDLISAYEINQRIALKQDDLAVPDQAEAEDGTATIERVWTAQRIAQAIAALAPAGVDEIVYQADCSTITNGFCIDTDDGAPYYWDGSTVTAISGGAVDLTAPGPIGSVTPNTGAFTTLTATAFDTSAPDSGETGEIGLQEDPDNGTNVVTLKAAAAMAADITFTLPDAYAAAANYAMVGDGAGNLSFIQVLLPANIGTTVQAYDADLADLADGSLTGSKVGSGIQAGNITTGILPDARLSALIPKWVSTVPTTATDTCTAGTAAYDSSYIYVCAATNTWVRAAMATW